MPLNDLISKAKNSKLYSTISKVVSTIDRDKERDGFQFISPQTRQNISQATQRVQQSGVLNPFNQLKGFSQALAPSNYGQTTKELFTPLLGEQKAGQLGYGLQGATQLTPSYGLNMLSSDYRQSVQQPQTQQEKDAQQIGRATYGLALTAPLGGANMARNVLARAFTGIGAGAGIGGAITAVTGGDIKQGVKQGAMSGYSFAPIGAITNPITSKILAGAPTLLQNQIGQRAIGGVANVIEDEIQALVDGYDTDTQSRVTSLLIGAALTGNKDAWAITKRKLNSLNVKNADELIKFSKTRLTEAYKDQGAVRLSWSEPDGSRRAVTVDKATQPGWIMYLNNRGVDYRLNFIKGSLGSVGGAPKPPTDPLEALKTEARKYKTTINLQDKNDLEYLERIFSKSTIEDILNGQKTNWRGESYEDLARANFISETPQTVEQLLTGKIKDVKLKGNTFYHGTNSSAANSIMQSGFKRGSDLPKEAYRGGGYGKIQSSISLAETPKEASIFSKLSPDGEIVEAKLKDNARVVSIDGVEDAVDLEDYVKYLRKQKVDAVYIGGGEKELVVLNPKSIIPTKSQLTDLYNQSQPKIPVKPIDRTQLTGKALSTPNEVLIKGKSQPELPAGKTQSEKELLGYEKGLTSSLQEQKLAQQGVGVKLKTQEPKKVLITTKSTQTPNQKLEAVRQAKAKSVKANQSDLPSIENTIRSSNLDVKSKVNILDYWLRTPDKVLRKIGLGKEAESIKTAYNNYLDELPKEINKVTEWYKRVGSSDEASQRIFKYLDGQDQKLTVEELKVATEIKSYLNKWADRLGLPQSGRIANYITHIFEQDFIQKEFDPELAKIIQDKVPGSVYDPFLQQRLGKLGYIEDAFRALDAYVKRATRKANMDPALSQLQEVSGKLDIDSWNYVKNYADRINLRPTDTDNLFDNLIKSSPVGYKLGQRPVARISRGVRQMVYRGTLGLNIGSAIRNLTQGVNTYAQLGEKYTAQGYLKAIQSIASKSDELERVGVLRNSFIEDRGLSATKKFWENLDKGLFYFFEMVEKINRGSAYYGAKSKALAQGLSEEQAVKAGVDMARKTQFTFGSVDTPVNLQSDIVKLLTQFQSFNVKQTEFLSDMAKNKEYAGMIRWLGANAVVLFTVGQAMGWDWKDMIPFGGVADGQSPIGSSPAMTLAKDVGKIALGETDKYGNPLKPVQLAKDLIPLIPGGVQINKTIGGLKDVSRGYDESTTGRVKFPIAQTPRNYIQGAVLGSYNLPEAKEYRKMEASVLGEKQSESYKTILTTQGKEAATNFYNGILKKRGMDVKLQPGESSDDMVVIKSKFDNTPELLTNDEIVTYYESKITKPKTGNKYEKAIYEKEIWSKASDINSRESLTQEQKDGAITKLLSNIGVSKEDYDYYEVAKQEVDLKTLRVYDVYDQTKDYDEFMKYLVNGRKPVNGKILISDGVIDNLVDDGLIPYALGKDLKSIDLNEDGSVKTGKIRAKSSKAKTDSIKAYSNALERLGDSLLKVNIKAPTVTSTSTNKINTKGLTFSSAGL